jgi:hypothetical protein
LELWRWRLKAGDLERLTPSVEGSDTEREEIASLRGGQFVLAV